MVEIALSLETEKKTNIKLREKLEETEEEYKLLVKDKGVITEREKRKSDELKRIRSREKYQREKIAKLEEDKTSEADKNVMETEKIKLLSSENETLARQLILLEHEKDVEMENLLAHQSSIVKLYDNEDKCYTPKVQMCVHTLLENHVSTNRVGPVIEAVLKLVDKTPDRLPSASTVNNMNVQRLSLSQKQLGDSLSKEKSTTIETDETSKFGSKYGVYAVRDSAGDPYVLGLRELVTKSGKDTLQTLKEILFDIDSRYYDSQNLISQNILFNIRNTMSDRAATEKKFNELLESYRAEILPEVVKDWESLHAEDRRVIARLNNFFCGLHSLVHIAEISNKTIKEIEIANFNGEVPIMNKAFRKADESAITRLIRTSCKAFSYQGDPKTSCHGPFMTFIKEVLDQNGMKSLPLTPFKGNRFNILFHNAGIIFFFHEKMIEFLEGHGSNQWVLHDLKVPFFISGCKALGLICKFVTSPLWNLIEKKDVPIMDMNKYYLDFTTFLQDANNHLDDFMSGKILPFGDETCVKKDKVYDKLIASSDHDGDTATILSVVLPAVAKLAKNHFKDHLPGGIFENPTERQREETSSVAKHNKFSESVFAYLDGLMRYKPHIKSLSAEAYIMFAFNKTSAWLHGKEEEEMKKELKDAYSNVGKIRKLYSERKDEIRKRKEQMLQEKLKKAEEAKKKKEKENLQQTNDVLYWGLWQTVQQVDTLLASMNGKEKSDALKSQLRFRRNILKQTPSEKTLYNFTKSVDGKRKDLTWEEMKKNVKTLIREACAMQTVKTDVGLSLVGHDISHKFEVNGRIQWYDGHVISQVPGFPSWFNVKYASDPAIYSYQLKVDYDAGDLVLKV